MSIKRKAKAFERGQDLWFLLPESERTAVRVLNDLRHEGFNVSKATVSRWANQWRQVAGEVAALIPVPATAANKAPVDLSDIPEWARKALPERLWLVAKGKGLDRVEDAVGIFAEAIGAAAPQLVEDLFKGDGKALRVGVSALVALASTMERIVHAWAMVSVAHRSFCEGDKLQAEGRLADAHAKKTAPAAVPHCRECGSEQAIKPERIAPTLAFTAEQEALATLRGSDTSRPRLTQ